MSKLAKIKKVNSKTYKPNILIISNTMDFSTDLVVQKLKKMNASFVRLDLDALNNGLISLDPINRILVWKFKNSIWKINSQRIKSIYFRAPTYLREFSNEITKEILFKNQWSAFARALAIFDNAFWINWLPATYLAEIKAYQLHIAAKSGLNVPKTFQANYFQKLHLSGSRQIVLKALENVYFSKNEKTYFLYSNFLSKNNAQKLRYINAPITFQLPVESKKDIRVTVVGSKVFAAEISNSSKPVTGDWRLMKKKVSYRKITLKQNLKKKCIKLIRDLGLVYGAIDFVVKGKKFIFLEINPTGEWGWLENNLGFPISKTIAQSLIGGN